MTPLNERVQRFVLSVLAVLGSVASSWLYLLGGTQKERWQIHYSTQGVTAMAVTLALLLSLRRNRDVRTPAAVVTALCYLAFEEAQVAVCGPGGSHPMQGLDGACVGRYGLFGYQVAMHLAAIIAILGCVYVCRRRNR